MYINKANIKRLDCNQASFIKRILGFKQRTHHSNLLEAVRINNIELYVKRNTLSLWKRTFNADSLLRSLCAINLARFILHGTLIPGSLVQRLISFGISPTEVLFNNSFKFIDSNCTQNNGIADSLRYLVMHEQFIKPYSNEYVLASLLVKAF